MRGHILKSLATGADLDTSSPAPPSALEQWRRHRASERERRSRCVVSLWCIPCGRDVATVKAAEIGQAALTRFAIEARDHDNTLSCGGLYEFATYGRKGKGERRRLEGVPKSDPRQLPQWRALIDLLFRRLEL